MVESEGETVNHEEGRKEGRKETEEPNFGQPQPRLRVRPIKHDVSLALHWMDEEHVTCGRRDDTLRETGSLPSATFFTED